jgi:N6-L-threonylcarbamoyladenine synthase
LEGHVYSNWIAVPGTTNGVEADRFPTLLLIVSGGHSELILMSDHGRYQHLGGTLDDAAGEAFDKVARLIGLGFPGGPAIQQAARGGDARRFALPRALRIGEENRFNFSFSGLKTAVLNLVRNLHGAAKTTSPESLPELDAQTQTDIAASFQAAVVDQLVDKLADAAQTLAAQQVCICGGVSANVALRQAAQQRVAALGLPLYIPPLWLCTDNAAMIGAAAYFRYGRSTPGAFADGLMVDVFPNLPLAEA